MLVQVYRFGTLNDLRRSGDKVNKIQAVLSGTLNFVFNNYDGTKPFTEVVRQAQAEGYTGKRSHCLDLGGLDVMRKIMILAAKQANKLRWMILPIIISCQTSCFEGSVEDFYAEMGRQETHLKPFMMKLLQKIAS